MTDAHKAEAERRGLPLKITKPSLSDKNWNIELSADQLMFALEAANQHFQLVEQVGRLRTALKVVESQFAGYALRIAPMDDGNDIILNGIEEALKESEPK